MLLATVKGQLNHISMDHWVMTVMKLNHVGHDSHGQ